MPPSFEDAFDQLSGRLELPDPWQHEAVRALRDGEDVIVAAPTGAGKTRIFELAVGGTKGSSGSKQAVFTVPTRALANDKWREWRNAGWNVGIATGDLAENLDAPVLVATLETQRERFLQGDGPSLLAIDEYQMIGDRDRGLHYELAVAMAPPETRLLLLSGSVSNPGKVADWLKRLGRPVRVVETKVRPVPLDEIPLGALPRQAPRHMANFWQRLAVSVLLSYYGPLLIFAPHRKAAEKIAAKIAEVLPEDNSLRLDGTRCSRALEKLLSRRVAYHHSGLSFAERAGVIEPLAKSGQLRVIVATMGLAAGIHFSVRSVFVSETEYRDGPFHRPIAPDELLQMYGRAGRRGLDETGYVVLGDKSPRLHDGYPLELRRRNQVDWPTLLRRMHLAEQQQISPVEAARDLRDRLFSEQRIVLGFGADTAPETDSEEGPLFGLTPTRREIRNAKGEWEIERPARDTTVHLGNAFSLVKDRCAPAESDPKLVSAHLPSGTRLCRLETEGPGPKRYGCEMMIAIASPDEPDIYIPTKVVAKLAGLDKAEKFTAEEIENLIPPLLADRLLPAIPEKVVRRGPNLALTAHLREVVLPVSVDSNGTPIHSPERRTRTLDAETHLNDETSGEFREPAEGTSARAWRSLGLIDSLGHPTCRGVIFSLFQGGEGLAIAAALEDPDYAAEDIVFHLANLRAGHRFDLDAAPDLSHSITSIGSERLAVSCRQAYGAVDHDAYLHLGLPPHYGENAAEIIATMLEGSLPRLLATTHQLEFGFGDVERAFVEWLSLLRHIRYASGPDDPRWRELQNAAAEELSRHGRKSPLASLPELPASVLQAPPQHGLRHSPTKR